jgi:zinc D-Ala-D-Ala carboxypeptidase
MGRVYFSDSELTCKCGACQYKEMDEGLMLKLNRARHFSGVPFVVRSAVRCVSHNEAEGGSKTSSHLKGLAVDIQTIGSVMRMKVVSGLLEAGFNRIGIYSDFVHVDVDNTKTNHVMWIG